MHTVFTDKPVIKKKDLTTQAGDNPEAALRQRLKKTLDPFTGDDVKALRLRENSRPEFTLGATPERGSAHRGAPPRHRGPGR
jgi:hypothetical protein